ncbi:hypothetical protein [Breoghania sp.]|uniref:hypothetical protein n=1 Tax=Breoghania sp. TaxID=2065378 RepID=UPI00260D20CE|nr:hypothetical protein [Breoghania sp.]MDJ0933299.1 hypothetical protein [Breoghania sp.]
MGIGKRHFRIPLGLIGIVIIAALIVTVGVWVAVVDDPYGGEPSAVVALNRPSFRAFPCAISPWSGCNPVWPTTGNP